MRHALLAALAVGQVGCSSHRDSGQPQAQAGAAVASNASPSSVGPIRKPNPAIGDLVLYQVQVRSANACRTDIGAPWQRAQCAAKIAPQVAYHARNTRCELFGELAKIRLGTLGEMTADTDDYRAGITLHYIRDRVGANAIWLMPVFPTNDETELPAACDNLGSPYAVQDYMHVTGRISQTCIAAQRDEKSSTPCWGDDDMEKLIADAHARGLKVFFDVAFNHFGHNYDFYDYQNFVTDRDRLATGQDLGALWNFAATQDSSLVHPELLDTPDKLALLMVNDLPQRISLAALRAKCPALEGQTLVTVYNAWRIATDSERERFACNVHHLEFVLPAFYLGRNARDPSTSDSDVYAGAWRDVKFLFHHEENQAHFQEFARVREYLFRVMNYWSSRGVDGFRLDHTTEPSSGLSANEWRYITSKVDYYAHLRGQAPPMYVAEEFHDQKNMQTVVDAMIEGYFWDIKGHKAPRKDASWAEWILSNMNRFGDNALVMTGVESHDNGRVTDGSGYSVLVGAGMWGMGATTRSLPMLLMGQEFGETSALEFRKSDFLSSRFPSTDTYSHAAEQLIAYYHSLITARLDPKNRALLGKYSEYLRLRGTSRSDSRIYAAIRWTDDVDSSGDPSVVLVFHSLVTEAVDATYGLNAELMTKIKLDPIAAYKLVDATTGAAADACRSGRDLAANVHVAISAEQRSLWLRLERCH